MRVFSIFSGIGGFDLALQRLGHIVVGACEIDKYARLIYGRHFPDTRIWEDATKLNPKELPDFDCIVGGFPCQAFSIAGKRRGFEDTRGSLFFEIARIAKEKRPQYLLLENVKGLLNHDEGRTFRTILATLSELGYDAEWQVLNSKYFVPQNRERVFIIGHLREKPSTKVFPLGDSSKISDGTFRKTPESRSRIQGQYSCAVTATYWKGWSGDRQLIGEPKIVADRSRTYAGTGRKLESPKDISNSLTSVTKDNYLLISESKPKSELYYIRNTNANMKQRHQSRDESWTIQTSGNEFGIGDGTRIRRLTPLECERLQGFPDRWTEGISDTQRYKCCGNAVTVPVVEYILSHMVQ